MGRDGFPPIGVRKRLAAFEKEKRACLNFHSNRAGFGSVMLQIMERLLSCLEKGMEFKLVPESLTYGFGYEKGWRDFFVPFCREKPFSRLGKGLMFMDKALRWPFWCWDKWGEVYFSWRKLSNPMLIRDHATWMQRKASLNLFDKGFLFIRRLLLWLHAYWEKRVMTPLLSRYNIQKAPSLSLGKTYTLSGYARPLNFLEGGMLVLRELWQFTPEVEQEIAKRTRKEHFLPGEYIAIHVRRGDRTLATPYEPISSYRKYMEMFAQTRPLKKKVFLMSDDYSVVGELQEALPGWEIHTLISPDSKGNDTRKLLSAFPAQKREKKLLFLTELMIAKDAQYFFGTLASNVFILCALLRGPDTCFYVNKCLDAGYNVDFKKLFDEANPEAVALRRRARG